MIRPQFRYISTYYLHCDSWYLPSIKSIVKQWYSTSILWAITKVWLAEFFKFNSSTSIILVFGSRHVSWQSWPTIFYITTTIVTTITVKQRQVQSRVSKCEGTFIQYNSVTFTCSTKFPQTKKFHNSC